MGPGESVVLMDAGVCTDLFKPLLLMYGIDSSRANERLAAAQVMAGARASLVRTYSLVPTSFDVAESEAQRRSHRRDSGSV